MRLPKVSKKMKVVASVIAIYLAASGPLGGLASLWVDRSLGGEMAWKAYYAHVAVYLPVIYGAEFVGAEPVLLGYWRFCGWEGGAPF